MPFFGLLLATCPLIANEYFSQNLAPIYFGNPCRNEFYAELDYLLWYAHQEGMSYATKADYFISGGVPSIKENDLFLRHPWDSGFKAAFGFKPIGKTWDTKFCYTFFYTKDDPKPVTGFAQAGDSHQTVVIPDYVSAPYFRGRVAPNDTISYFVNPVWRLYFNSLDLEFGKDFDLSSDASIRPFFGLKGVFITQKFQESIHFTQTRGAQSQTSNIDFQEKNDFSSFGARTGFDINYSLWKGFDFYGNFAGSLLWGWFHVRQILNRLGTSPFGLTDTTNTQFKHSHQSTLFNFDIGLGLRWNYWFNCDRNLLTIKLGWEQHLYTNINQFQKFIDYSQTLGGDAKTTVDRNIDRGDLTLSGWLFGLTYNF